jgi:hypothetical protein
MNDMTNHNALNMTDSEITGYLARSKYIYETAKQQMADYEIGMADAIENLADELEISFKDAETYFACGQRQS